MRKGDAGAPKVSPLDTLLRKKLNVPLVHAKKILKFTLRTMTGFVSMINAVMVIIMQFTSQNYARYTIRLIYKANQSKQFALSYIERANS